MSKIKIMGYIFLNILGIVIIPINLFYLQISELISLFVSMSILFINITFWFNKKHIKTKILLNIISTLIIMVLLLGTYCNPYFNSILFKQNNMSSTKNADTSLTYKEAKKDLDYAMKYLKKVHPALHNSTPKNIENRYNKAINKFKTTSKINVNLLHQEVSSIFSLLNDAHTHTIANYSTYHYLNKPSDISEAKLIKINNYTIEDIFANNFSLFSYELSEDALKSIYALTNTLEGLKYLNIPVENGVTYTYVTNNNETLSYTYTISDFKKYNAESNTSTNSSNDDFAHYYIETQSNTAFLTLEQCKYNDEYKQLLKEMFTEIKESKIQNIVIDLRNNNGGNSSVAVEFLKYINVDSYKTSRNNHYLYRLGPILLNKQNKEMTNKKYSDLLFTGNIYVYTSANTFSSAMCFAEIVQINNLGTIIGETPFNATNCYTEVTAFELPNSYLKIQISTKKHYIDTIEEPYIFLEPDIKCDASIVYDKYYELLK